MFGASHPPRPSILLATTSTFVIVAISYFLATFLAENLVEPNPFAMLGGLFIVPFCLLLAIQQYRGTFRRVPSAASMTSRLLYVFGGFGLFLMFSIASDAIKDKVTWRLMDTILTSTFIAGLVGIVLGRLNARWAKKLIVARASGVASGQRGFSIRELLLALGVVAFMTGIASHRVRMAPPRFAEHITAVDAPLGLPHGATDVSYGKSIGGAIAFEFTTDEAAFREWVEAGIGSIESSASGMSLQEITTPMTISRFYTFTPSELDGPNTVTVAMGLSYAWSKEDRSVAAAFDRTTGRAYYCSHSH